eukprot:144101-Hanusia_phi.AAC.4
MNASSLRIGVERKCNELLCSAFRPSRSSVCIKRAITTNKAALKKGDSFQLTRTFSQQDVSKFADVSGDDNPLHQTGATTSSPFARPVVHGIFVASMFSAVIGRNFPGSIYLNQQLKFSAPVYFDENVTARVTVTRCKTVKVLERAFAAVKCNCVLERVRCQHGDCRGERRRSGCDQWERTVQYSCKSLA